LEQRMGKSSMKSSKKSLVIKRSIVVGRRKTSVSVEDAFWNSLQEIAKERRENLSELVNRINADRKFANLSSAIRVFVICYYRDQYTERFKRAA
jgi:predicted DNA-binding ribbon-helix-helix protein